MSVAIELTLQGVERAAEQLGQISRFRLEDIANAVGSMMLSQTQNRLTVQKASPEGAAWPAWSAAHARTRHGGHALLIDSGGLKDSLANISEGLIAQVGVHVIHGRIHQFGGKAGRGHAATIPARPYLGLSPQDREAIEELVVSGLRDALA